MTAWTWAALNLQPSDLCTNAYRSLPGGQDIFSLSISCICIHGNSIESDCVYALCTFCVQSIICTVCVYVSLTSEN